MSYPFYSFVHIFSLMVAIVCLGGQLVHMMQGGVKENLKIRKQLSAIQGIALLIAFIAGFGLMARTGYNFKDSKWLYVKLTCWFLLGAYPVILFKRVLPPWASFVGLTLIVGAAVYAVTNKPF